MTGRIEREELRQLVRQALKEALGGAGAPAASAPAGDLVGEMRDALRRGRPAKLAVAVATSADLDRFARAIAEAAGAADLKAAIAAGELRFELAAGAASPPPPAAGQAKAASGGTARIEAGILGEARLAEVARAHRKIVVGNDVVVTPLARDRARELKVEIVRQKP